MTLDQGINLLNDALITMQNREIVPSGELVLTLAASSRLSSYDCEFVALAKETASLLVTADRQIVLDFPESAIGLDDFIAA